MHFSHPPHIIQICAHIKWKEAVGNIMFETHVTIREKGTCDLLLRFLRTQVYTCGIPTVYLVEYILALTYWTLFERKTFLISTVYLDLCFKRHKIKKAFGATFTFRPANRHYKKGKGLNNIDILPTFPLSKPLLCHNLQLNTSLGYKN